MKSESKMFIGLVRSTGDWGGVFEFDGVTGYFYLYRTMGSDPKELVAAQWILNGPIHFSEKEVDVRWDSVESIVGLFILGTIWAAYDVVTGTKYSGDYSSGKRPESLARLQERFLS